MSQRFRATEFMGCSWGCRGEQRSLQENPLSLPGPFAICNYLNPALFPPLSLRAPHRERCSRNILPLEVQEVNVLCAQYPSMLQLFPSEDEESRDRKAGLRTEKHHRCPSPTATTSIYLLPFATTNTWICNVFICSLGLASVMFAL